MNISPQDHSTCYSREPHSIQDGIPLFSLPDAYVRNYEKIASDHVTQISPTQENPFMEEELWKSLEASTRNLIKKHVPRGSRILDVGVGLGRLLEPLEEYDRYGVDISLDYLSIAKKRGIEVAMAKIEDLPYKPEFFDAIVVCDVLEHVLDLTLCTEKILSCLRPGGTLIVRVPYREDLSAYLNPDLPYDFVHLRAFDESSLWLHFHKIFGLRFVETATTTPYLQGTPRLKLRLLPDAVRQRLLKIAAEHAELKEIEECLLVSEEQFQAWIYKIKEESRAIFDDLSEDLIHGIEVNSVFIKPYHDSRIIRQNGANISSINGNSPDPLGYQLKAMGRDFLQLKESIDAKFRKTDFDFLRIESSHQQESSGLSARCEKNATELLSVKSEVESLKQAISVLQNHLNNLENQWHLRVIRKLKSYARKPR